MPPYDDPSLNEFAGYFEAKEPGRKERARAEEPVSQNWAFSITKERARRW